MDAGMGADNTSVMTRERARSGAREVTSRDGAAPNRWWRWRSASLTLITVGASGGAVFGGVFALILVLLGLESFVDDRVTIAGDEYLFLPAVEVVMGILGGLVVGILAAAGGAIIRKLLRRITRSVTALVAVTGVASACVAGAFTYWIVGRVLTLDPLPWTVLVALIAGLVLGRECYESSKRDDLEAEGNTART